MQINHKKSRPEALQSPPRDQRTSISASEQGSPTFHGMSTIRSDAGQQRHEHPDRPLFDALDQDTSARSDARRYNQGPSSGKAKPPGFNSSYSHGAASTNNTSPSSIFNSSHAQAYSSPASLYATSQAMSGGPSQSTPSRHLITILPPPYLPHDPPHPRTSPFASGYGPPQNFRWGISAWYRALT